jgi:hypothetical protein
MAVAGQFYFYFTTCGLPLWPTQFLICFILGVQRPEREDHSRPPVFTLNPFVDEPFEALKGYFVVYDL